MYLDRFAPLARADPTESPSTVRRPSPARPPWIWKSVVLIVALPPTSCVEAVTVMPGIRVAIELYWREVGRSRIKSRFRTCSCFEFCTSTTGVSPTTVMVSWTLPTFSAALTVTTPVPANSMPSVFVVLNPSRVKVIAYVPGRRLVIWYWPVPSVVAVRDFSMSSLTSGLQ